MDRQEHTETARENQGHKGAHSWPWRAETPSKKTGEAGPHKGGPECYLNTTSLCLDPVCLGHTCLDLENPCERSLQNIYSVLIKPYKAKAF